MKLRTKGDKPGIKRRMKYYKPWVMALRAKGVTRREITKRSVKYFSSKQIGYESWCDLMGYEAPSGYIVKE